MQKRARAIDRKKISKGKKTQDLEGAMRTESKIVRRSTALTE